MDKLLDALVHAINTGTDLAWPALVMFFILKTVEQLATPLGVFLLANAARMTILKGMEIYHEKNKAIWEVRRDAYTKELEAYAARRRDRQEAK